MDDKKILEKISKVLDDKKGMNIECIDVKEETTLAEYFIIASGTSNTHIRALADNVEEELAKDGIKPTKIEGYDSNSWILIDYGFVIVHIFTESEREFYNLDDLWKKV